LVLLICLVVFLAGGFHSSKSRQAARGISIILPDNSWGWVQWAFSLHELKRTKEAWGILISVVDKFQDEYLMAITWPVIVASLAIWKKRCSGWKKAVLLEEPQNYI